VVVRTVCVVEILTTDGINFSAKSAKESGLVFALILLEKDNSIKIITIFLNILI
jgi:hypothetical protein